jgi:hypothetical protein
MPTDEEIIHIILTNPNKQTKAQFKDTYPEFFRRCPVLSEKLFDPNIDKGMLHYMLQQKQQIMEQGVTEHEASVNVGNRLVNQYVKPMLNKETN